MNNETNMSCWSAGGLVTAVAPVVIQCGGRWVGWPGPCPINEGEQIPEACAGDITPTAGILSKQVTHTHTAHPTHLKMTWSLLKLLVGQWNWLIFIWTQTGALRRRSTHFHWFVYICIKWRVFVSVRMYCCFYGLKSLQTLRKEIEKEKKRKGKKRKEKKRKEKKRKEKKRKEKKRKEKKRKEK